MYPYYNQNNNPYYNQNSENSNYIFLSFGIFVLAIILVILLNENENDSNENENDSNETFLKYHDQDEKDLQVALKFIFIDDKIILENNIGFSNFYNAYKYDNYIFIKSGDRYIELYSLKDLSTTYDSYNLGILYEIKARYYDTKLSIDPDVFNKLLPTFDPKLKSSLDLNILHLYYKE